MNFSTSSAPAVVRNIEFSRGWFRPYLKLCLVLIFEIKVFATLVK